MIITVIRHTLVKTLNFHVLAKVATHKSPLKLPLIHSTRKYCTENFVQKRNSFSNTFSKKVKERLLSKVTNMDDPKVLEALAPFQASVKEQVSGTVLYGRLMQPLLVLFLVLVD